MAAPWKTGVGFASHLRFNKAKQSSAVTYARAENWQAETSQIEPRKESEVEAAICASLTCGEMGQAYWQLEDPKVEKYQLEK